MWLLTLCSVPLSLMSKQQWCDPFPWALAWISMGIMGLVGTMVPWYLSFGFFNIPLSLSFNVPLHTFYLSVYTDFSTPTPPQKDIMHYSIISAFLLDRQQDYHHKYSTKIQTAVSCQLSLFLFFTISNFFFMHLNVLSVYFVLQCA